MSRGYRAGNRPVIRGGPPRNLMNGVFCKSCRVAKDGLWQIRVLPVMEATSKTEPFDPPLSTHVFGNLAERRLHVSSILSQNL